MDLFIIICYKTVHCVHNKKLHVVTSCVHNAGEVHLILLVV